MRLNLIFAVTDFNSRIPCGHSGFEGMVYEYWPHHFLPTRRVLADARFPEVRPEIPGRLQGLEFFVSGPIPLHGIRPAHLSRESSGHRGLPSFRPTEALSHGHSRRHLPKHAGQRQRESKLAHLCRLRAGVDPYCTSPLYQRSTGRGFGANGIRPRFHYDRPVPVPVSMGAVPKAQRSRQDARLIGFTRKHPFVHQDHRRQIPRCESSGRTHSGTGLLLRDGPRAPRFFTTVYLDAMHGLLRDARQGESSVPQGILASGRQGRRDKIRPDDFSDGFLLIKGLSRPTPPHPVFRSRKEKDADVFNQRFFSSGRKHLFALQVSLADRTVFQMDQATPADQGVLWDLRECGQDPDMDRHLDVCPCCHHQETASSGLESLHNSTDPEHHRFREKAIDSGAFQSRFRKS